MSGSGPVVVAALSGGVDSATAAALLVEQGHRVVGMTMRLYDARGTPVSNAVHSGYQRIEAGNTVMLMDTGRPPPFPIARWTRRRP